MDSSLQVRLPWVDAGKTKMNESQAQPRRGLQTGEPKIPKIIFKDHLDSKISWLTGRKGLKDLLLLENIFPNTMTGSLYQLLFSESGNI